MNGELSEILDRLERLSEAVESLDRTVRGHDAEGNVGIIRRIDSEIENAQRVHNSYEDRLSELERAVLTFRAKVAGAAALGAAVGAGGTILASIIGLFGGAA